MDGSLLESTTTSSSNREELENEKNDSYLKTKEGGGLNGSASESNSNEKLDSAKKRISSAKTPNRTRETTRAKRVRFFRNGDKFYTGCMVAVSNERYK